MLRSEPEYAQVMDILADGQIHELTLGISHVVGDETEHPLISALISKTWIVPEGEPIERLPDTR